MGLGTGPKINDSSEPWNTDTSLINIPSYQINHDRNKLTAKSRVVSGDLLLEEVPEEWLEWRGLVEQQPTCGQVHVVRVPSFCTVEKRVTCIERAAERAVVGRIECIERAEGRVGDCRGVDEEIADERVEACGFL